MIRSAVTVSLVPEARGGPFVFWDDLPAAAASAARLGFDAIEVFPPGASAELAAQIRDVLRSTGLKLAAVGTGAGWVKHRLSLTDPATRDKAADFIRGVIDMAGEFGAPAIIGSMQGRFTGESGERGRLADTLYSLGEYATLRHGRPLLFEPLNRYETNVARTVEEADALLTDYGNVEWLCDLFHMNIEEADVAAALRQAGDRVGHVHFVDSNRRAAGFGHIDYGPIRDALLEIGYDGYLSAEALPVPDSEAAARQTIKEFRRRFR